MLYQFLCTTCGHEQEEWLAVADYDKKITKDGKLKRKKCEECKTISLYRHITKAPQILGGTNGYMSVERYLRQNPDQQKRKEEELSRRLEERHRKKVLDQIDKQQRRGGADKRGQGYKEDRLSSDE